MDGGEAQVPPEVEATRATSVSLTRKRARREAASRRSTSAAASGRSRGVASVVDPTRTTRAHAAGLQSSRTARTPSCSTVVLRAFFGGSRRLVGFQAKPEPQAMRCFPTRRPAFSPHQYWA